MIVNPLGIHAGVWGFDWSPDAADRAIRDAAEVGFDLIEVPAIDRTELEAADTRRALERHGIAATVSLALSFADDISDEDPDRRARGEHRLTEAVLFAEEIGATFVGGVVFSAMGRYLRLPTDAARERSLAVLRRVTAEAATRGIAIGVEYVNRYESNLLNTSAATRRFVDDLGAENAVVHLDTFHAAMEETSLADAVAAAGERLGYIHASESHRGPLGTGSIDWSRFAADLATADYRGPITVESFAGSIVGEASAIDIALWRPQWSDPRALAAASLDLLRGHLSAVPI